MRFLRDMTIFFAILIFILFLIHLFLKNSGYNFDSQLKNKEIEKFSSSYLNNKNLDNYEKINKNYIKFSKMPITYSLDIHVSEETDGFKLESIRKAFSIIENLTDGLVTFKEVKFEVNADIKVTSEMCGNDIVNEGSDKEVFTEGLGGPVEINNENIIVKSEVKFCPTTYNYCHYSNGCRLKYSWLYNSCKDFPYVEIHEILHAFGFGHIFNDTKNIMYPIKHRIQACQIKKIDEKTIKCLKSIYSNELNNNCMSLNMFPWYEEREKYDFKWDQIPIKYRTFNCYIPQIDRLQKAEQLIEKKLGYNLYEFTDNDNAQVEFYCENYIFENSSLNTEADFWEETNYFPAAQPHYYFKDNIIEKIRIILFAQNRDCGGVEVHELLHSTGLRKHYGIWMKENVDLCPTNVRVIDKESFVKLREIYNFSF